MVAATYASTADLRGYMGLSSAAIFTDDQYQDALDRAEAEVNKRTSTKFLDGTATTPAWLSVSDEKHTGKGINNKTYFTKRYPLPDVSATVSRTAVTAGDTSIFVDDTQGFPSSGTLVIETDKINYTGKTGTAFTGVTNVSAAHGTAETVSPHIVEISMTDVGLTPSWTVMEVDKDVDIDLTSGRVHLFESSLQITSTVAFSRFPAYQVPNRLRVSYLHGRSSLPDDVIRLTLMIAAKDLVHKVVTKSHSTGQNDFNPDLVDIDEKWIDDTIKGYKSFKSQST